MTLAATATYYTPEDLLALPDYGRFELIDGQLVERKMGAKSSYAATRLLLRFGSFVEGNNLGLVFQADCGYQIFAHAPNRVRFADASFIRRGQLPAGQVPWDPQARSVGLRNSLDRRSPATDAARVGRALQSRSSTHVPGSRYSPATRGATGSAPWPPT